MTVAELTKRVEALEHTVQELALQVQGKPVPAWRPWREGAGRFKNDPFFDEMVRLGAEYRDSLRPKPRRRKRDRA
jgi:hypothetical protein